MRGDRDHAIDKFLGRGGRQAMVKRLVRVDGGWARGLQFLERGVSEKKCERSVQVERWAWPGGARCGRCGRRGDAPLSCCSAIRIVGLRREEDWVRDFAENERQG